MESSVTPSRGVKDRRRHATFDTHWNIQSPSRLFAQIPLKQRAWERQLRPASSITVEGKKSRSIWKRYEHHTEYQQLNDQIDQLDGNTGSNKVLTPEGRVIKKARLHNNIQTPKGGTRAIEAPSLLERNEKILLHKMAHSAHFESMSTLQNCHPDPPSTSDEIAQPESDDFTTTDLPENGIVDSPIRAETLPEPDSDVGDCVKDACDSAVLDTSNTPSTTEAASESERIGDAASRVEDDGANADVPPDASETSERDIAENEGDLEIQDPPISLPLDNIEIGHPSNASSNKHNLEELRRQLLSGPSRTDRRVSEMATFTPFSPASGLRRRVSTALEALRSSFTNASPNAARATHQESANEPVNENDDELANQVPTENEGENAADVESTVPYEVVAESDTVRSADVEMASVETSALGAALDHQTEQPTALESHSAVDVCVSTVAHVKVYPSDSLEEPNSTDNDDLPVLPSPSTSSDEAEAAAIDVPMTCVDNIKEPAGEEEKAEPLSTASSIKIHLNDDDDTDILMGFLNRAKASKAAKIALRTSLENRRDSDAVKQALASPRKVLDELDTNSPTPARNDIEKFVGGQALGQADDKDIQRFPGQNEDDWGEVDELIECQPSTRRSTRSSASKPATSKSGGLATPNTISVRRTEDSVVLKKSDAQEMALMTRANTRRNKGGALPARVMVLKLKGIPAEHSPTVENAAAEGRVRWNEDLVAYFDEKKDRFSDDNPESSSHGDSETSRPRARRAKTLGAVNGTPAKSRGSRGENLLSASTEPLVDVDTAQHMTTRKSASSKSQGISESAASAPQQSDAPPPEKQEAMKLAPKATSAAARRRIPTPAKPVKQEAVTDAPIEPAAATRSTRLNSVATRRVQPGRYASADENKENNEGAPPPSKTSGVTKIAGDPIQTRASAAGIAGGAGEAPRRSLVPKRGTGAKR